MLELVVTVTAGCSCVRLYVLHPRLAPAYVYQGPSLFLSKPTCTIAGNYNNHRFVDETSGSQALAASWPAYRSVRAPAYSYLRLVARPATAAPAPSNFSPPAATHIRIRTRRCLAFEFATWMGHGKGGLRLRIPR